MYTKKLLKKIILEEINSILQELDPREMSKGTSDFEKDMKAALSGTDELLNKINTTLEKISQGIEDLDTSMDYVAAGVLGGTPLGIDVMQQQAGRLGGKVKSPEKISQTPQQPVKVEQPPQREPARVPVKEPEKKPKKKTY